MAGKSEESEVTVDGNVVGVIAEATIATIEIVKKTLDVNKYATKKTIAQGLLDVALLTANASQLKYVLQVGEKHEFYSLMLSLISISIILQVTAGLLSVFIAVLRTYHQEKINTLLTILNQISLGFVTGTLFCDIIKMNFGLDPALAVNDTVLIKPKQIS
ncbi:ninjurin-2 isoform X3 [Sitophilus oryzae]|uniref:Ninjurin-2 isoform X3 n=1 Tax=Sitophilus oryzae TaxID=7048 RepID=A0A6J2XEL2_SITOR|nr:ninjurin-2 isoform X3 [Sitophilus oryzae]